MKSQEAWERIVQRSPHGKGMAKFGAGLTTFGKWVLSGVGLVLMVVLVVAINYAMSGR